MIIQKITKDNFSAINLDEFNRQQKITQIYVKKDGKYVLEEQHGIMDWTIDKKKEVARDLVDCNYISYLALEDNRIIGFMSLVKKTVSDRMILGLIQVDQNYRGKGIGRELWKTAVEEVRRAGAKKYIYLPFPLKKQLISIKQWAHMLQISQLYLLPMMSRTTSSLFVQLYKFQFNKGRIANED